MSASTPSPVPTTLRRLVARFAAYRTRAAGVFGLLLVRSAVEIANPLLIAALIDTLVGHEGSRGPLPDTYVALLIALAGVILVRNVVWYAAQVQATALGQDLENGFRTDLFRHVLALRFRYHDENRAGKTIARSLRDMEKARHFFREVWFGYLEIGLLATVVLGVVFVTHWSYGLAVLGAFGLGVFGSYLAGRRISAMDREVSDVYDEVTTALQENVAGAQVIRAFGREQYEVKKFGGRMDRYSSSWQALERFWTGVMPTVNHVYHLCLPIVLWLGATRIASGAGSVGEVTAILLYVRLVHHRVRPLTRLVILGQQAVASASRVFEVLDDTEVFSTSATPHHLPPGGGDLVLEDVVFGHDADAPVLCGVSVHVPPGSSLGILGPTGSGKSSLVQLLPRFYDPDGGRILLDGVDVADLPIHELRAAVGLVFQEPFLFSGTVAFNVAYGKPTIPRAVVEECARQAAAHTFVEALPQGYETIVGERGVSLSGGQRQRLTIARALAMDPRILIFDDATASVDAVTERTLFEGIRAAAEGRTTLVISQRVTSVRWCDRIALLEEGRITHVGTHEELAAAAPLYQEILRYQQLTQGTS